MTGHEVLEDEAGNEFNLYIRERGKLCVVRDTFFWV